MVGEPDDVVMVILVLLPTILVGETAETYYDILKNTLNSQGQNLEIFVNSQPFFFLFAYS